jgi:hypothetical protein
MADGRQAPRSRAGWPPTRLAPRPGAADANERRGADGETFLANRSAAPIAYFVYAGIDFPQGRVNGGEMLTRLRDERRNMLPFEGDRRTLRVMLVIAPGRALTRAGDDRGELPLKLSDPVKYLLTIGIQPEPALFRVSHLRRLSLTETIPSAGERMCRLVRQCEGHDPFSRKELSCHGDAASSHSL